MITIENLEKYSRQEVFDFVVKHLLTQNKASNLYDENGLLLGCAYRGKDGMKCAVGCLIPDHLYDENMESNDYETVMNKYGFSSAHHEILSKLQTIHDMSYEDEWKEDLEVMANEFDLAWNFN